MSTISLGKSGIVGISYSETSLLKSNLMRANERRNSASNNINSAKVKLQVNGRSGRIRVETDNLQSYYSSLKSNNSKIEKIIRDIDYIVRKFKEVDSRCASRVRAISRSYKVQSFISKIGNSLISFGNKVFNGISNFIKDGISIIKNIYNSSVSWINSYGFYGSLSSGNFNLGMYPGLAMAGMGVGVTTLGPIIPGGVTNNNKGVEEYLKKSFNQLLLGNFTNDVTALGTVGQVGLGLLGADLPLDIRDISADFINWEWSWKHAGQTALDLLALLPIIGAVKYADEAWLGLKNGFKVIKNSDIINKIGSPLLDSAKAIGAYIKKAPDLIQYFRGGIKNIGDQIDNIGYNIRKVMGFEPELVADGVRIGDIRDTRKLNSNDISNLNDRQKNYNKIVNGGDGIEGVSKATDYGKYSTIIDDKVKVIDKVDLPEWIGESFTDGNYRTVVAEQNITFYRTYGGGAKVDGSFVTTTPAGNRINAKINTALVPEWKNSRQYEAVIEVPKGTTINIGRVEKQYTKTGALLEGNGDQILLPQGWSSEWIKEIREVPSR